MTNAESGIAVVHLESRLLELEDRVERQSALIEAMMKYFAAFDPGLFEKEVLRGIEAKASEIYRDRTWHANENPQSLRERLGLPAEDSPSAPDPTAQSS